ncbi:MAG: hypothetical protein HON47_00075 [Candidatus Diapherotrites archaeon]|uniref:Uncharacterized protein n=1 Tax=Candidatus Iainarchaeum sp. TaxID=3101447 RepID=A0A8T5GE43_9ARCH|nr:hypothetical protein [Candidatus Diapherotrites archaeon]
MLEDANAIAERIAPLQVSRYLAMVPHPYNLPDAEAFLTHVVKEQANNPRAGYEIAITKKNDCIA